MVIIELNHELFGTLDIIISAVSQATGIPFSLMPHKTRKREVVQARQMVMWLACRTPIERVWSNRFGKETKWTINEPFTDLSLKEIGRQLGGRDHTTVIHGRNFIQDIYDTFEKSPGRLTEAEREIMNTIHKVEHKLNLAKIEYEKTQSRRDDNSEHAPTGEDGPAKTTSSGANSRAIIQWDAKAIRGRSHKERGGSDIIHYGESCTGKSRIIETHFTGTIQD